MGILGHLSGISERCERQAVKCASRALNSSSSAPATLLAAFPKRNGSSGNNSYLQLLSRASGRVGGQQWEVPPGLTAPLKFYMTEICCERNSRAGNKQVTIKPVFPQIPPSDIFPAPAGLILLHLPVTAHATSSAPSWLLVGSCKTEQN